MPFSNLKKRINKCNQYITEKLGRAEGTKLNLDFTKLEKKTDVTCALIDELQSKTKELLQPNPTARAKTTALRKISKLRGRANSNIYPQPEGALGDCMTLYGKKLEDGSALGIALVETGESLKQLADVKQSLDDNLNQNFLEPLHHFQTKDMKRIKNHRKKLESRRLAFDFNQRQANCLENITDEKKKFEESLHVVQSEMFNLLDNDVEHISQLAAFAEGLLQYHNQCSEILGGLAASLQVIKNAAANRPKLEFVPKSLADLSIMQGLSNDNNFSVIRAESRKMLPVKSFDLAPCCTALYDFDQAGPQDLSFKRNDVIRLIRRIDENWFEGALNGCTGYLPVTYVKVDVALP